MTTIFCRILHACIAKELVVATSMQQGHRWSSFDYKHSDGDLLLSVDLDVNPAYLIS